MNGRRVIAAVAAVACAACAPAAEPGRPASWTLVVGLDVSGSFRDAHYDDAVEFAAHYIHAHLNGLGDLRVPTALFVGSVGGTRADEPKAFHPINDFAGRSVEEIATDLRAWFPPSDGYTDFNVFFERVSGLIKERGLILAPIHVVVFSDGVPDVNSGARPAAGQNRYAQIDVQPLEFLARSVTVRLLYASPTVGEQWKTAIERRRVRLWTQDAVMAGWRRQLRPGIPVDQQDELWAWVRDNVDFRVRAVRFM
jgi:hypothetical protein